MFNWDDNGNIGSAHASDKAILAVYCEALGKCIYTTSGAPRSTGSVILWVPAFVGQTVHLDGVCIGAQPWQDFFFNDVKKLRSKASNLTRELDEWAEKTTSWIKVHGNSDLIRNLKIKPINEISVSSIYLFAISKNAARMQGYGYTKKAENLAIANWPQFVRNRFEIGPADRVIYKMFEALLMQENSTISLKPLPITIPISGHIMNFEDLWNSMEN